MGYECGKTLSHFILNEDVEKWVRFWYKLRQFGRTGAWRTYYDVSFVVYVPMWGSVGFKVTNGECVWQASCSSQLGETNDCGSCRHQATYLSAVSTTITHLPPLGIRATEILDMIEYCHSTNKAKRTRLYWTRFLAVLRRV